MTSAIPPAVFHVKQLALLPLPCRPGSDHNESPEGAPPDLPAGDRSGRRRALTATCHRRNPGSPGSRRARWSGFASTSAQPAALSGRFGPRHTSVEPGSPNTWPLLKESPRVSPQGHVEIRQVRPRAPVTATQGLSGPLGDSSAPLRPTPPCPGQQPASERPAPATICAFASPAHAADSCPDGAGPPPDER